MSKFLKYTRIALFCLTGVAFISHILIPHDHHVSESYLNQDSDCPVNGNNNHNHNGLPVHCHAFNDLTAEKDLKQIQLNKINTNSVDYNSDLSLLLQSIEPQRSSILLFDLEVRELFNFSPVAFRAPPLMA